MNEEGEKMLVHICCAVDSHYFLQKLRDDYPDETLVGFFYDPNIHPYSEYFLRLLEVRRSCEMLEIELIEGAYDMAGWLDAVRGLEDEPEKGARCSVCFDHRLEASAQKAVEIGETLLTTTLLTSPKKSIDQLRHSGKAIGARYGIEFVTLDYRKGMGTQEQNRIAKADKLYRQDYCGCVFALKKQRQEQERLTDELMAPISGQIQPESIEERIALYEQRLTLEKANTPYTIVKERFLNWRLESASLRVQKQETPAHFLPYSTLKKGYTRGKIEQTVGAVGYLGRDEVKCITLAHYNHLANTNYTTIQELLFNPPDFETELDVRHAIVSSPYDLSTILVVETLPQGKIEFELVAHAWEDVRERLVVLSE
jgi:predicted adenine nucleotide alpha hydrolase (AANH) superfamily ATPase